jgi:hypothetical protein
MKYQLLSEGDGNAKTAKNALQTYILYLSAHTNNSHGINICPKASKGCAFACLVVSGMAARFANINTARRKKTDYMLTDPANFYTQLSLELQMANFEAHLKGEKIAIRLNGTSDQDHIAKLKKFAALDVRTLKNLVLYDYTKILGMVEKYSKYPNVHLTFSRSEENEEETATALATGHNVSAVFYGSRPDYFNHRPVTDGDKSDIEMTYYKNVVLGLTAKGPNGQTDRSGFVIRNNRTKEDQKFYQAANGTRYAYSNFIFWYLPQGDGSFKTGIETPSPFLDLSPMQEITAAEFYRPIKKAPFFSLFLYQICNK